MVDYPKVFAFDMAKARLIRTAGLIAASILLAIPVVALLQGAATSDIGLAVIAVMAAFFFFAIYYFQFLACCFYSGNALEIHADHIVVATPAGILVLPRHAVKQVKGPGEYYHDPDQAFSVVNIAQVLVSPELVVGDSYKVRNHFGFKVNPIVQAWPLIGAEGFDVLAALKRWHAET
ncbi:MULTISPECIES: hypothetical protein [Kordiimonas]|jgi:hypothetical protein|uniref:hypothetical protein n=1 Tax=Kordiimonas TaxID=288021 RepID=UPI00257B1165|nr:hypothetical protein [Kordiimonas sp. UBA4487]